MPRSSGTIRGKSKLTGAKVWLGALSSVAILARIIAHAVARRSFIDRIWIDVGRKLGIEDAIAWIARHGVKAIDVQTDIVPNTLESFDEAVHAGPRRVCYDQHLDRASRIARKRRGNLADPARRHRPVALRKEAAIARLVRTAKIAESAQVQLLLENRNDETRARRGALHAGHPQSVHSRCGSGRQGG